MPKKRGSRGGSRSSSGSGAAGTTVLAFILGATAATGAGYLYLHSTPHTTTNVPPAEPISPGAPTLTGKPATPAPSPAPPRVAPFGTSEDVFESGAHLYSAHCASCHGTPEHDAPAKPPAHQLWRASRHTIATQKPADLYGEIADGAPAKGMPAYAHILTDTQIWQLALLLKNADQDLPDPVVSILKTSPRP